MDSRVRALYKIDPQPEGPAQARRIIADELAARVSGTVLDDVTLMVSELVTNGIVHGSTEGDVPVMLDVLVNGDIRCRVLDSGRGFASARAQGRPGWLGPAGRRATLRPVGHAVLGTANRSMVRASLRVT